MDDCKDKTKAIFKNYNAFKRALKIIFGDPKKEKTLARQLINLKQKGAAFKYATEFKQLAAKLGQADKPLIEIFYYGLKNAIKDDIIRENKPNTLSKYIEMAIKINNR